MSVSCIEELDISSLYDTRVYGELNISIYALYIMLYVSSGLSSLLHIMHVCREANLASSSSWMCISCTSLLLICFILPLCCSDWQKGGERFWVYICIFVFLHILSLCILCFWGECFWKFKRKGGESFWKKNFGFMHVSLTLLMHIFVQFHVLHWIYICSLLCMS